MKAAFAALQPLDDDQRQRAIQWLIPALGVTAEVEPSGNTPADPLAGAQPSAGSGSSRALKVKDFMTQKKPTTAVERMACLAFYLTHMRDQPVFKTPDLVALNTEAAGMKFANARRDLNNADHQSGFVVSAGGGDKQITSRGEAVVVALPDREKVAAALTEHPFNRRRTSARKPASRTKAAAK
jgi:hypothetical protein